MSSAWNCRGSGGSTVSTLNRYLQCTNAKFACVSESRCGVRKASQRIQELVLKNSIIVPSQGKSGGLWLLWDDDYDVSQILKSSNLIAAKVKGKGPQSDWIIALSMATRLELPIRLFGNKLMVLLRKITCRFW